METSMRDIKSSVRYLGFHGLADGGRRLEFSFSAPNAEVQSVFMDAPHDLFSGPDNIVIQECAAICYETLKCLVETCAETIPASIVLTPADVAQHRKPAKTNGNRRP